jgi:hypothetical protein
MKYPTRSDVFGMNSIIDYTKLIKLQSEANVVKKKVKTLNVPKRMDVKNNDKRK